MPAVQLVEHLEEARENDLGSINVTAAERDEAQDLLPDLVAALPGVAIEHPMSPVEREEFVRFL